MKKNETVMLKRTDLIEALEYLNQIVVSLDRIGSYASDISKEEYEKITIEFLHKWKVWKKLSKIRSILSEPFSRELGEDDMDELERELQHVQYWSINCREPKTLSHKKTQKDIE